MKYQNSINEQINAIERELALLDAKKKALKARISQLKDMKQSNADGTVSVWPGI